MKSFKQYFKPNDETIEYNPNQVKQGKKVEKEHTKLGDVAETIAKHHLEEDPEYYDKLEDMENLPKKKPNKKVENLKSKDKY